ncbi:MAG: hypothetical protein CM15mP120_21320 [Pseudomonadota bacterium]|nr:MAG: hypothetical protein CM15mP120_21320 [Pseudomonadota bacterium]
MIVPLSVCIPTTTVAPCGGDRIGLMAAPNGSKGTLFGNGERTGNCDLVTVAMNMFSQGVDPTLDLRHMPKIREVAESVTKLSVHERHPYAGELVFTAFRVLTKTPSRKVCPKSTEAAGKSPICR